MGDCPGRRACIVLKSGVFVGDDGSGLPEVVLLRFRTDGAAVDAGRGEDPFELTPLFHVETMSDTVPRRPCVGPAGIPGAEELFWFIILRFQCGTNRPVDELRPVSSIGGRAELALVGLDWSTSRGEVKVRPCDPALKSTEKLF
jgi:hypothetical protein